MNNNDIIKGRSLSASTGKRQFPSSFSYSSFQSAMAAATRNPDHQRHRSLQIRPSASVARRERAGYNPYRYGIGSQLYGHPFKGESVDAHDLSEEDDEEDEGISVSEIYTYMKENRISQIAVAREIGVSSSSISRLFKDSDIFPHVRVKLQEWATKHMNMNSSSSSSSSPFSLYAPPSATSTGVAGVADLTHTLSFFPSQQQQHQHHQQYQQTSSLLLVCTSPFSFLSDSTRLHTDSTRLHTTFAMLIHTLFSLLTPHAPFSLLFLQI